MEQVLNKDIKGTILIVDDEESICEILQYNLEKNGYNVSTSNSAEEAIRVISSNNFDLILLDIMLGGISGIDFSNLLRKEFNIQTPIIFISALGGEPNILKGFENGGDDYISKPFSINEVIARVGAVITRYRKNYSEVKTTELHQQDEALTDKSTFGPLNIDFSNKRAYLCGNEIVLTKKEWSILEYLATHPGKLISRQEILKRVWRDNTIVTERTVDVHIARLRKKLGEASNLLVNRSGYGYSLNDKV